METDPLGSSAASEDPAPYVSQRSATPYSTGMRTAGTSDYEVEEAPASTRNRDRVMRMGLQKWGALKNMLDVGNNSQSLETLPRFGPTKSALSRVERLIRDQFGELADEDELDSSEDLFEVRRMSSLTIVGHRWQARIARLVENQYFAFFFMIWTFYALFVPDLELLFGNKDSQFAVSIVTTGVCFLFFVEIVLQSLGRPKYIFHSYFWLDLISFLSLLPETWLVYNVSGSNQGFVAGRSSRLMRLLRVVIRAGRATRFSRLIRVVRIAAILPHFRRSAPTDDETEKVLEKKLSRVFRLLDEDMQGSIARVDAVDVLLRFRGAAPSDDQSRVGRVMMQVAKSLAASGTPRSQEGPPPQGMPAPKAEKHRFLLPTRAILAPPRPSKDSLSSETSSQPLRASRLGVSQQNSMMAGISATLSAAGAVSAQLSRLAAGGGGTASWMASKVIGGLLNRISGRSGPRISASLTTNSEPSRVSFGEFYSTVLADDWVARRLRGACEKQLHISHTTRTGTKRHSEVLSVKVAFGALLLVFMLKLIKPKEEDNSHRQGLAFCETLMREDSNWATQGSWALPDVLREPLAIWMQGIARDLDSQVLYLDIGHKVFCSSLVDTGPACPEGDEAATLSFWRDRVSLIELAEDMQASDYRQLELEVVAIPDLAGEDISPEELNRRTTSAAVILKRGKVQAEAAFSMVATLLILVLFVAGILLLTKDLTFLSRTLLQPLAELADDMESIVQLQWAGIGVAEEEDEDNSSTARGGASEVRLIQHTFKNMKKAIKSWGKYVPWPVVQVLLHSKEKDNVELKEAEVTVFFSDIASFTTIVEGLPPESSLLLLSRYFNDMSKIIDDQQGIVLDYIGDAILCMYGAPLENDDHPSAAVRAALQMMASLKTINKWARNNGLPEISVRCGVHTGRVLVGTMGVKSRLKYGIVGEESAFPSRLEELNKTYSTGILISSSTLNHLCSSEFVTRPIDYVHLSQAGDSEAELIHEVMIVRRKFLGGKLIRRACALHATAMRQYRAMDFAQALENFKKARSIIQDVMKQDDVPSTLMLQRCEGYLKKPPPDDWDGTWQPP